MKKLVLFLLLLAAPALAQVGQSPGVTAPFTGGSVPAGLTLPDYAPGFLPSVNFTSHPNAGFWLYPANQLSLVTDISQTSTYFRLNTSTGAVDLSSYSPGVATDYTRISMSDQSTTWSLTQTLSSISNYFSMGDTTVSFVVSNPGGTNSTVVYNDKTTFGKVLQGPAGATTGPAFAFSGDTDKGMWNTGTSLKLQSKDLNAGSFDGAYVDLKATEFELFSTTNADDRAQITGAAAGDLIIKSGNNSDTSGTITLSGATDDVGSITSTVVNGTTTNTVAITETYVQAYSGDGVANDTTVWYYPTGVVMNHTGSLPTCDASVRGYIRREPGATTVYDQFLICAKRADDTYGWQPLNTPIGHELATDEVKKDLVKIDIANGAAAIGSISWGGLSVTSNDATSAKATFACVNVSDTETCDVDTIVESSAVTDADTITCVFSIDTDETNAVMLAVTCNQEDDDANVNVNWKLDLLTVNTVTPQ